MRRLLATLLLVLVLCPLTCVQAQPATPRTETNWMTVLLGGRKIGSLRIDRVYAGDTISTTQTLSIMLNRNGTSIPLSNVISSLESDDSKPLGFGTRTRLSAMESTVEGKRQADGTFQVETIVGGARRDAVIAWPAGAVLNEGQRKAMMAASAHPGTTYPLQMFDPATQSVMDVSIEVIGNEQVQLPDGTETLSHQRQRLHQARGDQILDLWLDHEGRARRGIISMLGRQLEMQACSEACATAPVQDVDMFRAAMVDSPRPLTSNLRRDFLRYKVHVKGNIAEPFIQTDEQRITPLGNGDYYIDVGMPFAGGEAGPTSDDTQANAWLQSDAPAIRSVAAEAVGNATSNRQRMRLLRLFVSRYINQHGLDVGYASALEVLNSRQGDCTEYAVLLAALARSQGIPARVVTGMVYADRYGGASRVFLPHAWVQAWVDGRWQSYDAALRRFDMTHIALSVGDGDPWRFFSATELFNALQISDVWSAGELMAPTPPQMQTAGSPGVRGGSLGGPGGG
ncbi:MULTISPECIES: transglutaminase-like domain-containing protein [Dyella]|nr:MULTISPECIES: transglutaminase-like domain-containing protein [Dyella]